MAAMRKDAFEKMKISTNFCLLFVGVVEVEAEMETQKFL